jgi:hypothetical protein
MDHDERTYLLKIALAAQALLARLDTLTFDEFCAGAEQPEREALREALKGQPHERK